MWVYAEWGQSVNGMNFFWMSETQLQFQYCNSNSNELHQQFSFTFTSLLNTMFQGENDKKDNFLMLKIPSCFTEQSSGKTQLSDLLEHRDATLNLVGWVNMGESVGIYQYIIFQLHFVLFLYKVHELLSVSKVSKAIILQYVLLSMSKVFVTLKNF